MLDALADCGTVAFDKTGTLTTGSLACTSMRPLGATGGSSSSSTSTSTSSSSPGSSKAASSSSILGLSPREAAAAKRAALSAAVALSLRSSHPVSDAVVLHGQQAGLDGSAVDVSDFELVPGGGVLGLLSSSGGGKTSCSSTQGSQQQQQAAFGSLDFVSSRLSEAEVAAVEQLAAGRGASSSVSVLVLGEPDEPAAAAAAAAPASNGSSGSSGSGRRVWVLGFEDSVRKQSAAAVRQLQTVSGCCAPGCAASCWNILDTGCCSPVPRPRSSELCLTTNGARGCSACFLFPQGSWTGSASQAHRKGVTMLTGDNEASAQRVARRLGIADVQSALRCAPLLPVAAGGGALLQVMQFVSAPGLLWMPAEQPYLLACLDALLLQPGAEAGACAAAQQPGQRCHLGRRSRQQQQQHSPAAWKQQQQGRQGWRRGRGHHGGGWNQRCACTGGSGCGGGDRLHRHCSRLPGSGCGCGEQQRHRGTALPAQDC